MHRLMHPAFLGDLEALKASNKQVRDAPEDEAVVLYSETQYGGFWLPVHGNIAAVPDGFAVHSARIAQPAADGSNRAQFARFLSALQVREGEVEIVQLAITFHRKRNFQGRALEFLRSTPTLDKWNGLVRSVSLRKRTRRVRAAASALSAPHSFLVITNRMLNPFIPGNLRAFDIAAALRQSHTHADAEADADVASPNNVHFLTYAGGYHTTFAARLDAIGVRRHADYGGRHKRERGVDKVVVTEADASSARFDPIPFLQKQRFHTAFIFLWFWAAESAPERYLDVLREYAPETRIVVVSEDAQGVREAMMHRAIAHFPALQREFAWLWNSEQMGELQRRERNAYRYADLVVTVTDRDRRVLLAQFGEFSDVRTLHWGTNLTGAPIPASPADVPAWGARRGIVFLGHFDNPTNRLALQWFFASAFPLLPASVRSEPIYLVGQANKKRREKRAAAYKRATAGAAASSSGDGEAASPVRGGAFRGAAASSEGGARRRLLAAAKRGGAKARAPAQHPFATLAPSANITLTGRLDNAAMLDLLRSARLMISPILASTGMNTKNLYAMSAGCPVVTTTLGAEGLRWEAFAGGPMERIFERAMSVADGSVAFAAAVHAVYTQAATHARLLRNGLALARHVLTGSAVVEKGRRRRRRTQFERDLHSIVTYLDEHPADATKRPTFDFVPAAEFVQDRYALRHYS